MTVSTPERGPWAPSEESLIFTKTSSPQLPERYGQNLVQCMVVVIWQLSCWGSYHLLKRDCVADAVPLYQYTHWNWYSFC